MRLSAASLVEAGIPSWDGLDFKEGRALQYVDHALFGTLEAMHGEHLERLRTKEV